MLLIIYCVKLREFILLLIASLGGGGGEVGVDNSTY